MNLLLLIIMTAVAGLRLVLVLLLKEIIQINLTEGIQVKVIQVPNPELADLPPGSYTTIKEVVTERLVQLLRDLPMVREAEAAETAEKKRRAPVRRGAAAGGRVVARKRSAAARVEEEDRGDDGSDAADAGSVAG